MSDAFFDKFIADLVKGAGVNSRTNGGPGVSIDIVRGSNAREEKLAMDASTMLSGIPGMGPALGGLNAAARSGNMGHGFATGLGGSVGQALGGAAGSALGGLSDSDKLQMIATLLGSSGGGMLGASAGRHLGEVVSPKQANVLPALLGALGAGGLLAAGTTAPYWAPTVGKALKGPLGGAALGAGLGGLTSLVSDDDHPLRDIATGAGLGALHGHHARGINVLNQKIGNAYNTGAENALTALGIKVAFLPMLGAIAGPMLARAGVGALGRGVAGKAIGGIAGKVAPRIAGGLGGAAFDQAASMAGGVLGQKVQQPQSMMG